MTISSNMRSVSTVGALVIAGLALAISARGYELSPTRWAPGTVAVNFTRNANVGQFPDGSPAARELAAAADLWNEVPGKTFTINTTATCTSCPSAGRSGDGNFIDFQAVSGVLAVTFLSGSGDYFNDVDIIFNPNLFWSYDDQTNPNNPFSVPYSFRSVAAHEFGHALGLRHEYDILSVMDTYYGFSDTYYSPPTSILHADDHNGVRVLYPNATPDTDLGATAFLATIPDSSAVRVVLESPFALTGSGSRLPPSSATLVAGTTRTMQYTIENFGTSERTFVVAFVLSTNPIITTADRHIGQITVTQGPGSTVTRSTIVTIPTDVPYGSGYFLGWFVDDDNSVSERRDPVTGEAFNNGMKSPVPIAIIDSVQTITASGGVGGSIAPSGTIAIDSFESQTFSITPAPCHQVADVLVDGNSVGRVTSYTFTSITASHTIVATFAPGALPMKPLNSGGSEGNPTFSNNGLAIIYESNKTGIPRIYRSTRTSTSAPFGVGLTQCGQFNPPGGYSSVEPWLSSDGLRIYVASNNGHLSYVHLNVASRSTPGSCFGPLSSAAFVNLNVTPYNSGGPSLSGDERTIYFDFDGPGGSGGKDIWFASRPDTSSPFGTPQVVPGVNSANSDNAPEISGDGLRLYFSSTRAGSADLWMATRQSTSESFGPAVQVSGINSEGFEGGPALSPDDQELYFQSDRSGGLGATDIWGVLSPPVIIAGAGSNGAITPSGTVVMNCGVDQSFAIAPESGYNIGDVQVDGASVGPVAEYVFTGVTGNHTIIASFTNVVTVSEALPTAFALRQNWPNPFQDRTSIRFDLPVGAMVRLDVFDVKGRRQRVLLDRFCPPGYHSVVWDRRTHAGSLVPPGVYFCRIQAGTFRERRRMVLLQ